jgi:HD-like signal output (HDOD) protein
MRRILFVDDEPHILEGLRHLLRPQRHEWELAFAPGGEAALALLEASPYDVIISDMRMPGIDGAALLTRVREKYPQVVRIVLSGHTDFSVALRAIPVAHQFLVKPCDTQTLRVAVERASHLKALLHDETIRQTVGALRDLPSLPRTYEALTQALRDPDVPLHKIAAIVEQDVGISAKILQLVNSAFFGMAQPVINIPRAVNFLGVNTLKSLILSVEVFRIFQPRTPLRGFDLEALQRHARITALIAARLPLPAHLSEISVVAGMLHDVGKLIMAWKLPDRFAKLLAEAEQEHCPLHEVEEREYGFSHAEVGAYLLGLWGLPYAVVEAVALHHRPDRVPHRNFDTIGSVFVANLLAREIEGAGAGDSLAKPLDAYQGRLTSMGIEENIVQWRADMAGIPQMLSEA